LVVLSHFDRVAGTDHCPGYDRLVPTFIIRPAVTADVDAVLAFWRASAEDTNRSDNRVGVRALLARDPEGLILAEDTRGIAGSLIAGWDGWRYHLYRLAVRSDRRRQGIGRALLDSAEQRFAALGARRVDAMVLADNELGQQAWVASGYQSQPEWSRWVKFLPEAASELGPVLGVGR
jgi:ribosomal protein S18 acetylase RimI-like enzyme